MRFPYVSIRMTMFSRKVSICTLLMLSPIFWAYVQPLRNFLVLSYLWLARSEASQPQPPGQLDRRSCLPPFPSYSSHIVSVAGREQCASYARHFPHYN